MASLGFQTIYRELNAMEGVSAERAFAPDTAVHAHRAEAGLRTYESLRPVGDFKVVAFSLAYELEIAGVVRCLDDAGIPVYAQEREERPRQGRPGAWPLVVIGGPLTFSNPVPAGPYADVMLLGEAEELVATLMTALREEPSRPALLRHLARLPGFYVPAIHGEAPPAIAAADNARLPAFSQVCTPDSALSNMFLVEPARGCHRGCTYCVMRRSTNGGMRLVEPERVLATIPAHARRVGLVGAAVTDHPRLPVILRALVDGGREIGISSLRADRLNEEIVGLLKQGGYRTLTTASDGASERLRNDIQRKTKEKHLLRAAELSRWAGFVHLKIYMMLGLPSETHDDIEELARFALELAGIAPKLVIGIAPFVAKRNTPLDGQPFEAPASLEDKLALLRRRFRGRVTLRAESPKWALIEHRLAQGGFAEGRAVRAAVHAGARYADWKAAMATAAAPQGSSVKLRVLMPLEAAL
jgi:radical SAM superfamily enzyme YgiQ (UPF0313 family)